MIVFIHIPKTAGSSLYSVFRTEYRPSELFKLGMSGPSLGEFRRLDDKRRANIKVLYGHVDMSVENRLSPGLRYVTVLREPVQRMISYYYYTRYMTDGYMYERTADTVLRDWIEHVQSIELDNGMVRQLCGRPLTSVPFGECTAQMLEEAKANLERFFFVGLTERFDESYAALSQLLGWKIRWYRPEKKNTKKPDIRDIDREAIAAIKHHNRLDMELYDFGAQLFERRLAQMNIRDELELLRRRRETWSARLSDQAFQFVHDRYRLWFKKIPPYRHFG